MVDISGRCPAGFGAVRDAFAENFEHDGDVGASVAVTLDGELVVDLWGGTQDVDGTRAVGGGHDHQRLLDHEDDDRACRCSCWPSRGLRRRRRAGRHATGRSSPPPARTDVLVRHLLSHTAGLPGWDAPPRRRPTSTTGTR